MQSQSPSIVPSVVWQLKLTQSCFLFSANAAASLIRVIPTEQSRADFRDPKFSAFLRASHVWFTTKNAENLGSQKSALLCSTLVFLHVIQFFIARFTCLVYHLFFLYVTLACLDWSSIFIIKSYWLITIYKRPFSSACLFKALVCSKYIQGRYDEVN